jgi:diguanylate cyclase (GGDEF)-like protein
MPAAIDPRTVARSFLLPWLILATALAVTWLVWDHERQAARKELQSQFDFALREAVSRVEQRMAAHEQMLRGVQGLFAATGAMDRAAFRDYVDALQLDANFAGIQAIGIAERVPAERKDAHVAAMRRLGFVGYAIEPSGEREMYAPIIQREPYIGRNRAPPGFDPWSDPARRHAMEKARDSGMAALSGKVRLAVDTEVDASPGFVMYLPIFARGQPRDSVAQRRTHLVGWVFASFRMNDLMASLYGKQAPGLAFAVYDGVEPSDRALLYRSADFASQGPASAATTFAADEYLVLAGHTWTLSMRTLQEFETRFGRDAAPVIAVTGTGLGLLLALLAWLLVTGRARALRLAAAMTEELRHMAQHDALTDLPNRALFSDRLNHELIRAKRHRERFALIFIDLDYFKPINDNFGHAVGDLILQQVAQRLRDSIRASDTVGRIGGDEFVVLIPELVESNDALGLAEKIRQAVRQPFVVDGRDLTITCSLGVAVYPDDGGDEVALTKSADVAMYQAKESGRDSVRMGT